MSFVTPPRERYRPLLEEPEETPPATVNRRRHESVASNLSVRSDIDTLQDTLDRLEDTLVSLHQRVEHIQENQQDPVVLLQPIKKHKIHPFIVNNMLLSSLIWQVANVALLMATNRKDHNTDVDVSIFIMIFFQGVHIVIISMLSIKLVKQVMHTTISIWFLVQSYLSTILLFAGVYMLVHRVSPESFVSVFSKGQREADAAEPWLQFIEMIYFSTATQTTVGYGDLHPREWYTYLLTCVQMLLSVMYSTAIFSLGLAHFSERKKLKAARERLVLQQRAHALRRDRNVVDGDEGTING